MTTIMKHVQKCIENSCATVEKQPYKSHRPRSAEEAGDVLKQLIITSAFQKA